MAFISGRPLPAPAAAPSRSAQLFVVWAFLRPAFDHILKSPTRDTSKPPGLTQEYYSAVYTACYNYVTTARQSTDGLHIPGLDLFSQLETYFADAAKALTSGIPADDSSLIRYLISSFTRYSVGVQYISRTLTYFDRYTVKYAEDEDKGWLVPGDLGPDEQAELKSVPKESVDVKHRKMSEKRKEELKRNWGYTSKEDLPQAEASAEAGSPPGRVVPVASLAYRHYRLAVVEPLLEETASSSDQADVTKCRLVRATEDLLASADVKHSDKQNLTESLSDLLRKVGIRPSHVLRKTLAEFLSSLPSDVAKDEQRATGVTQS